MHNHLAQLDNLPQIDFSHTELSPFEQVQHNFNEIFEHFPIESLSLWINNPQKTCIECLLHNTSRENDHILALSASGNPSIGHTQIPTLLGILETATQGMFSSDMGKEAEAQINALRPEPLHTVEIFYLPIHSSQGIEAILSCQSETPLRQWPENTFLLLLNHLLNFSNMYLSYRHSLVQERILHKNELLNEIEEIANVGGWEYDVINQSILWTDHTYHIYGIEPGAQVSPEEGISYYPEDAQEVIREAFTAAISQGIPYEKELRFTDKQGHSKWIRTTGKVRKTKGVITHVYGAFEDISREKELIDHEKDAAAYVESILNNLNDAVITIDQKGIIKTANKTVKKVFGYDQRTLTGKNISLLMPAPYRAMHDKYMKSYLKTGNAKIIGLGRELPAMRKNGEEFPMELSLSEVIQNGERFFIGIIRDLTDRKEAEDKLFKLAFYDSLTDLPNRTSFERDLQNILNKSEESHSEIYASMINIDRFSQINLTYGKASGDYALKMIASRINSILPHHFKLYRNAADTFFLLYEHSIDSSHGHFLKHTSEFCQDILQRVSDELIINEHSHNLTVSVGSGFTQNHNLNSTQFINMLEFAVSKAQQQGGNTHITVDQDSHAEIERKALISNSLSDALQRREFSLVLQPQFDTHKNIVCSEILIRWHSESLGFVSPAEFIPIAEESGKIVAIGDWVLDKACQILATLRQAQIHTTIAVNISAKQIIQPDFSDKLLTTTKQWKVFPEQLILELTETTLVSDIELVKKRMEHLSKIGFKFSIDDFGTGYSSLSYLRQLPLHELKIDRYFIDEIELCRTDVPIVNSIIHMAKALGVQVVAEGVENEAQMQYLQERQCDTYQGFHLSKPLPIEQWYELFNRL